MKTYKEEADPSDFAPNFEETPEPYGNPIPDLVASLDKLREGSRILDFAGGYGKYAVPLAKNGFNVTILDIHDESLTEARKRNILLPSGVGSITAINYDVLRDKPLNLPLADAVFCAGFIHHLTRQGATELFSAMTNMLLPGGMAVIEFSTDKHRRLPDGTPILVGGSQEHNMPHELGLQFMSELFDENKFSGVELITVPLKERQYDFWYDAKMIIASGVLR